MRRSILVIIILLQILGLVLCKSKKKVAKNMTMNRQQSKYTNPNAIKDRKKSNLNKPLLPDEYGMDRPRPFHPGWMDYCDPSHCADYHKIACGLNRRNRKFQWFQSGCHIALNNKCATYRGFLKFDQVDTKYCRAYVMFALRAGCPQSCSKVERPVCAVRLDDNMPVVFKNRCTLYARNCREQLQQYVEVSKGVCINQAKLMLNAIEAITDQELRYYDEEGSSTETNNETFELKYYIE